MIASRLNALPLVSMWALSLPDRTGRAPSEVYRRCVPGHALCTADSRAQPRRDRDRMRSIWARRRDGSSRRMSLSVRRPRVTLALVATIVTATVVFSGGVGDGALPTASLPAFGVTGGNGSLSTVAELGDVNGDGYGDYAVGVPSSDAGGADSGIVYVFLGHAGALSGTPTAINLANASFRITGHGSEMLGYTVVGNDVNDDGLADIAIGAPMAGTPGPSGGGAVYVVFGRNNPTDVN